MTINKNPSINPKRRKQDTIKKKISESKKVIEEVDLDSAEKIDDGPNFVAPTDEKDIYLTGEDAKNFLRILGEKPR